MRRLLLILCAVSSLASGAAVPRWLWDLKHSKRRPAAIRHSWVTVTPNAASYRAGGMSDEKCGKFLSS